MSWQCIELTLNADKESYFSDLFEAFGALSVTTSGADETQVFEIDGQVSDSWQSIRLTAMFDDTADLDDLLRQLADYEQLEIRKKQLDDEDWERSWLSNFKPLKISDRLWICPSWLDPVDPQATTVIIDPGMSFGTGTHQSTRLCLEWISEQNLADSSIIDYGCGSGILAIAALKLGAKKALATDIEARSLAVSKENACKNNVDQQLTTCLPEQMPAVQADLVIANILAGTIIELAQVLSAHTKPQGQLLLAGILSSQEQSIKTSLDHFQWQTRYDGDWVAMLGKRKH